MGVLSVIVDQLQPAAETRASVSDVGLVTEVAGEVHHEFVSPEHLGFNAFVDLFLSGVDGDFNRPEVWWDWDALDLNTAIAGVSRPTATNTEVDSDRCLMMGLFCERLLDDLPLIRPEHDNLYFSHSLSFQLAGVITCPHPTKR